MAVKIRLMRMGAKKRPFYRIVATEARRARDGKYLEVVGFYNPLTDPAEVKVNKEALQKWVGLGAQITETVKALLKRQGIL
ncbi:MAG: 30S ribosomal protein S16 [Candidatus Omnitrophota bacterium]|nr:30S ribosomal protein S16 [Candidatus Desulfofervidus auxilii]RKY44203.1 MAG: 30S ribosomal protein S16 [Candidatus Omnitrophota bacterium]